MTIDQFKGIVADLARPFAIISSSAAAAVATIVIAWKVTTFGEGALFIGAVYAGLGGLYGFRAWENSKTGKHAADVEIAKAGAPQ
ncbi:hypothetical protein [Phenylobacterium sp.]|uniref:hypothetical protein n=1 Tax=Phenylobacterium sp. TaxID=1871053 RepID=UPI00286E5D66|nr:hypothetical protein [Phenylobacterium sp.]